ncbi:MAG: maltotransferase domain-containing protein [Janthinobacterium lividum]
MDLDSAFAPRIYYIHPLLLGTLADWGPHLDRAAAMGFDHVLIAPPFLPGDANDLFVTRDHGRLHPALGDDGDANDWLARLADAAQSRGLSLLLDVALDRVDADAGLHRDQPHWFHPPGGPGRRIDPRAPNQDRVAFADFGNPEATDQLIDWWSGQLRGYADAGVAGFRFDALRGIPAHVWRRLGAAVRESHPPTRFLAWTPGLGRDELTALEDAGFDSVFSSVRWWDFRSDWLVEEQSALARVATPIGFPEAPFDKRLSADLPATASAAISERAYERALTAVAGISTGWLLPMGFEFGATQPFRREHGDVDAMRDAFRTLVVQPRFDLQRRITELNRLMQRVPVLGKTGVLCALTGPDARATALLRTSGPDSRGAEHAVLIVVNPDLQQETIANAHHFIDGIPGEFTLFASLQPLSPGAEHGAGHGVASDTHPDLSRFTALRPFRLAPGEIRLFDAHRSPAIVADASAAAAGQRTGKDVERELTIAAVQVPRIAIEAVSPAVDEGRFPAKRVVGERVQLEADIFMDGHDKIAAVALWREAGAADWQELPLRALGNDRWATRLPLLRLGAYEFTIEAWRDTFGTLVDHIVKKQKAGQDVALEIEEARLLFESMLGASAPAARTDSASASANAANEEATMTPEVQAADRKAGKTPAVKTGKATRVAKNEPQDEPKNAAKPGNGADPMAALRGIMRDFAGASAERKLEIVLDDATRAAVAATRHRDFQVRHPVVLSIQAERAAARFANWYELFPRSQSGDLHRHGTFIDVIPRLPDVSAMGFDVLYFPPIHPIGLANRKGPNNTLTPGPEDVGSPYAIGSADGGHTALHPELGSFDDFKSLLTAARCHGLEIALDFAIQCSPDHPWLQEHPTWFAWRPDGTLRYAENPPKKYQDIVNPDFYAADAVPELWLRLRDVVFFWIGAGINIFRVDNPHTKPLPFWEWMIGEVRRRHPQVIFLSEAFTRPKVMNRLAKVGFSQSYTYFTWRETQQDFIDYLTELTQTPVREYFRPNFFVNTPDINPRFLQRSGRAGFVLRAALAATLAGVWGVYSGFELCEAAALPNSEEYLDSEKYQIRSWDWQRPGNIIREITLLNRIRRTNPALHTHLNITFLPSSNPNVLFFEKATENRDNVLLVAISLVPDGIQESNVEVPLWKWKLRDDDALLADDLVSGERFEMRGKYQTIRLDPQAMPFAIRRVSAPAIPGRVPGGVGLIDADEEDLGAAR